MIANLALKYGMPIMAVFLALCGLFYYGHTQYQKGYQTAQAETLAASIVATKQAGKDKVGNEKKYKPMETIELDRIGTERGWVRSYSDR